MSLAAVDNEPVSVLAAAMASGKRLEMVREPDGSLAITLDGLPCPGCRWPAPLLEQCVTLYLMMLKNQGGS